MDQKRHMLWRTYARVRYSAAYPTGRERMLEPRYECAEESFAFGGKPHEVRPMVWPDRRSLRGAKSLEACPQGAARERVMKGLLYHGVPIVF